MGWGGAAEKSDRTRSATSSDGLARAMEKRRREPATTQTELDCGHPDDTAPLAGFTRGNRGAGMDEILHAGPAWPLGGLPKRSGHNWLPSGRSRPRAAGGRHAPANLSSEFPRKILKRGGVLRERPVGIEKHVAPESSTSRFAVYVHGWPYGRHCDAVRLKTMIPGKKAKQLPRKPKLTLQPRVYLTRPPENGNVYL